ncbi:MAG: membrane protein insertion efficiency factor YidD [Candidatus Binataceae bacterium]
MASQLDRVSGAAIRAMLAVYRATLSPLFVALFGNACRFEPTCSVYASQAIASHGAVRGTLLATRRVARCHPWGGHGIDPVPGADARTAAR